MPTKLNIAPTYFKNETAFRKWLEKHHQKEKELYVGYYKVGTNKPSMTWSQSVDQALCFGWIDGVRRSIDDERYCIRFTPRKPTSIWSEINIQKVAELNKLGLMTSAGQAAYDLRTEHKSRIYSHENDLAVFSKSLEQQFKSNKPAWKYFIAQPPSYQKVIKHWVMQAKQEKTRIARLEKTIHACEQQTRLL